MISGQNTIAELKAINVTGLADNTLALVVDGNRSGSFRWRLGNFSARITDQTVSGTAYEGVFVAANSDTTATNGVWERIFDQQIDPAWFTMDTAGGTPSAGTNGGAIQAAFNIGEAMFTGRGCTVKVPPGSSLLWDAEVAIPDYGVLDMRGVTVNKGFNGDMARVGDFAEIYASFIDGKGATYSGGGFIIDGNGDQVISAYMQAFKGLCIDCLSGSGKRMRIVGRYYKRVDTTAPAIRFPHEPSNGNRLIEGCYGDTLVDLRGTDNFVISNCNFTGLILGGHSRKGRFTGNRIANGSPIQFRGVQHTIGDDNVFGTGGLVIEDESGRHPHQCHPGQSGGGDFHRASCVSRERCALLRKYWRHDRAERQILPAAQYLRLRSVYCGALRRGGRDARR